MPQYKFVHITCYCGEEHDSKVNQKVKCSCGITLLTQQKKNGDGKVWGRLPSRNHEQYKKVLKMIQEGRSKLDAEFLL